MKLTLPTLDEVAIANTVSILASVIWLNQQISLLSKNWG